MLWKDGGGEGDKEDSDQREIVWLMRLGGRLELYKGKRWVKKLDSHGRLLRLELGFSDSTL